MTLIMGNFRSALPVIFLTILIFFVTKNPLTSGIKLYLSLLSILVFVVYLASKRGEAVKDIKRFVYLLISVILLLVAATGWFFSPFFFSLYLLGILIAFIFSNTASVGFILSLVILFSFNIGDVDLAYDFLVVLSLITVLPLGYYLRKEYLHLRELEKDILVIKKEATSMQSQVEEVLANKITAFAVNMRQPINDIKQLTYQLEKKRGKKAIEISRERIITSSEEALRVLKEFEEQSTGEKVISTPETV